MTLLTVSQLVILDELNRLYADGEELKIPKSHLKMAFPLHGSAIDFDLAKTVLGLFKFSLIRFSAADNHRDSHWVLFEKFSHSKNNVQK